MPRKPAPKLRYTQEDVEGIIKAVLASSPPADMQRQISELMEEIRVLRAERLNSGPHSAIRGNRYRDMNQEPTAKPAKRRGPVLKSDGPVAAAARAAGVSVLEIARRLKASVGVSEEAVKKWDQRGRVPSQYKDALSAASKAQ